MRLDRLLTLLFCYAPLDCIDAEETPVRRVSILAHGVDVVSIELPPCVHLVVDAGAVSTAQRIDVARFHDMLFQRFPPRVRSGLRCIRVRRSPSAIARLVHGRVRPFAFRKTQRAPPILALGTPQMMQCPPDRSLDHGIRLVGSASCHSMEHRLPVGLAGAASPDSPAWLGSSNWRYGLMRPSI